MEKLTVHSLYAAAIVFLAASCAPEQIAPEAPESPAGDSIPVEIKAEINQEEITKTQYTSDYKFGWTSGDQIRMPVVKKSGGTITACDFYTFTTSSESGSASATFIRNNNSDDLETFDPNPSQTEGNWTNMGYLVYPYGIFNKYYSGDYPAVDLPSTINYSTTNPLDGGVVPMIGRKNGETYLFSSAVGFIKLTLANTPSTTTSVNLVSSGLPVSGRFAVSDESETVARILNTSAVSGSNQISLSVSGLTGGETYDFYFPLPVGTYDAGTLSVQVVGSNAEVLLEKTIGKSLEIERNIVLSIPQLLYHRVYVLGSISNPLLYTVKPSTANTIRTHISTTRLTSSSYNSSEWVNGNRFGGDQNGWALVALKNAGGTAYLSSTNNYYLQYIISSDGSIPASLSSESVMAYGSVPFKYMTSSDLALTTESQLVGTYTVNLVSYWDARSTSTLVIESSDNPDKGNVKITSALGQSTAIYGTYSSGVLTIAEDQDWYVDGNGATHKLINNWNGTYTGNWSLTLSAASGIDLCLGNSYLVNEWFLDEDYGYNDIYKGVDCIKQ